MDEDLRSASASMAEVPDMQSPVPPPYNRPSNGKGLEKIVLVVAAVVVLSLGLWVTIFKKSATAPSTDANTTAVEETPNVVRDIDEAPLTELFKSVVLGIELTYPKTWTVTEVDNGVRVESTEFTYKTTDRGDAKGNFRIYIRKGAREVDGKYIGRGVAFADSEKLVYTKPAAAQRTETLLSLFGLDTADNFGFFLIAGNFNLKKGDTLGPSYGKEPDTYIVAGGYSSNDLVEDLQTNPVSTEAYAKTKAYTQAIDIVKSLKLK